MEYNKYVLLEQKRESLQRKKFILYVSGHFNADQEYNHKKRLQCLLYSMPNALTRKGVYDE